MNEDFNIDNQDEEITIIDDSIPSTTGIDESIGANNTNIEPEPPKKKNNVGTIIIIFLVLIIMCLVGYILYDKLIVGNNNSNNTTPTNDEPNKEPENVEKELQDESTKKQLNSKIDVLLFSENYNPLSKATILKKLAISDKEKLYTILCSIQDYKPISIKIEKVGNTTIKNKHSDWITEASYPDLEGQIDENYVDTEYKKLFGEAAVHQDFDLFDDKETISNCPAFYYDSVNSVYYRISECGGTGYPSIIKYMEKITQDNNYTYAYLRVGVDAYTDGKIYSDIEMNNTIENGENKINESNKDKFSQYKFTFESKDGNFIFKSIERIK